MNRTPTNLGNPTESTVLEIAELVIELTGSASSVAFVERPLADPSRRRPDITRAGAVLGWRPTVDLRDGLERTIAWARDEPAG